mmetsp:Transcript_11590/g.21104  ORF Transcript_11590/g.21104 Transcript_11590/m.21104 type:complete len:366 (+) Transcript_11590:1154-2251(+)
MARAVSEKEFEGLCDLMQLDSPEALEYLRGIDKERWVEFYIAKANPNVATHGFITNGMAEAQNSAIRPSRELNPLRCVEGLLHQQRKRLASIGQEFVSEGGRTPSSTTTVTSDTTSTTTTTTTTIDTTTTTRDLSDTPLTSYASNLAQIELMRSRNKSGFKPLACGAAAEKGTVVVGDDYNKQFKIDLSLGLACSGVRDIHNDCLFMHQHRINCCHAIAFHRRAFNGILRPGQDMNQWLQRCFPPYYKSERYRDAFVGITFSVPAVGDIPPVCLAPSDSDDEDSDASIVHLGWEYTPLKPPTYKTKKRGRPQVKRLESSGSLNNTSANVPLNPNTVMGDLPATPPSQRQRRRGGAAGEGGTLGVL